MPGYKKRGRGGKGRGRGRGRDSCTSNSSVEPLDDDACRKMGFDRYNSTTGQCENVMQAP